MLRALASIAGSTETLKIAPLSFSTQKHREDVIHFQLGAILAACASAALAFDYFSDVSG
jgi:hypothetical protein